MLRNVWPHLSASFPRLPWLQMNKKMFIHMCTAGMHVCSPTEALEHPPVLMFHQIVFRVGRYLVIVIDQHHGSECDPHPEHSTRITDVLS